MKQTYHVSTHKLTVRMVYTAEPKQPSSVNALTTSEPAFAPEEPHSIFDKRQKRLILVIVSTAATCKCTYM
jgi:hypothetical protein